MPGVNFAMEHPTYLLRWPELFKWHQQISIMLRQMWTI